MAAIVRELGDDGLLALTGKVGERTIDGAWVARHAVHDATHHLSDTGRDLYALVGVSAPPAFGSVESINVSDGGVPKRPVPEVVVGRRGLEGDRQRSRKHHGRVWQALCLYSIDVIEALANKREGSRLLLALMGLLSVAAGVIVVSWPAPTLTVLAWIAGLYLVIFGLFISANAFSLRHMADT